MANKKEHIANWQWLFKNATHNALSASSDELEVN